MKQTDAGSNLFARLLYGTANYDNFGDFASGATTGFTIGGYANLTISPAVLPYEPGPNYLTDYSVFLMEPVIGSSVF